MRATSAPPHALFRRCDKVSAAMEWPLQQPIALLLSQINKATPEARWGLGATQIHHHAKCL
jgi:hypothetical protein